MSFKSFLMNESLVGKVISGAGLLGIILSGGLPFLACIDTTDSGPDYTDTGKIVDHIIEFEEGEIEGFSANSTSYFSHFCPNKSVHIHPKLSGGMCIKNLSRKSEDLENNIAANDPTVTFKFTSDKTVYASMDICVASKYSKGWVSTSLGDCFSSITNNDKKVNFKTVLIPGLESENCLGNYFNMQTVNIPQIKIFEGENTLVFKTAGGFLNTDYINLKTSAKIVQTNKHKAIDPFKAKILSEPTPKKDGSLIFSCDHENCEYCTIDDSAVLPSLSEDNGYKSSKFNDTNMTCFSSLLYDRELNFLSYPALPRQVGEVHNELKKGTAILNNKKYDPFVGSSWCKDDGKDTPFSTKEMINDKGEVVFEKTAEEDTSARSNWLYTLPRTSGNSTYLQIFDNKAKYGEAETAYGLLENPMSPFNKELVFKMTVNANKKFRFTFGGTQTSKQDLSVEKDIGAFDFETDGTVKVLQQSESSSFRTPRKPADEESKAEIYGTSSFELKKDQLIEIHFTRYDYKHVTIKLYVNNQHVELTSTIPESDVRSNNLYVKDGNYIYANRNTSDVEGKTGAGGGFRAGFMPADNGYVTLKDLVFNMQEDTFNPVK